MSTPQLKKGQLISLTLILIAYFLVWIPNSAAGLKFIGLEVGEWVKFLPPIEGKPVDLVRYFFFLPPITIALSLHLFALKITDNRYQIWGLRLLATLVSLLISPALEQLQEDPIKSWLPQILLILLPPVMTIIFINIKQSSLFHNRLIMTTALIGFILPLVAFITVHPAVSTLFGHSIPLSPGIILNTAAHLMLAFSSYQLDK